MEFEESQEEEQEAEEEGEEEEEEEGTRLCLNKTTPPSYPSTSLAPHRVFATHYRECLKNHAVSIGGYAVDGCGEFMAFGSDGLRCAACGCHRSFHRKENIIPAPPPPPPPPLLLRHVEGKKRHRTKFTAEQKERMVGFAEKIGWRIQRQDEELVQRFCEEIGVKRSVLKVWMHNNKHTFCKRSQHSVSHHDHLHPDN